MGAPPEDSEYLLGRLGEWLNRFPENAPQLEPTPVALLKAIVAHLYLAWIHPFGDGNGRTARLVELQILLSAGIATPATHLLSNHYNQTRSEYYRQLDRSSRSDGDPLPFIMYAIRGFVDQLRDQLHLIWKMQFEDRWEQYVYQRFGHYNQRN